jgi:hypothetical protein
MLHIYKSNHTRLFLFLGGLRPPEPPQYLLWYLIFVILESKIGNKFVLLYCCRRAVIPLRSRCYTVAVALLYYCRRAVRLLPTRYHTAAAALLYCCRRAVILLPSRFYIAAVARLYCCCRTFILLPSPLACCSTHAPDADDLSSRVVF